MTRAKLIKSLTFFVSIGSMLFASLGIAFDVDELEGKKWHRSQMPIKFYFGKAQLQLNRNASIEIPNTDIRKSMISNLWNTDRHINEVITDVDTNKNSNLYEFELKLECVEGDSDRNGTGCPDMVGGEFSNKRNEIHFNYWFTAPGNGNAIAMAKSHFSTNFDATDATGNTNYHSIFEADIFFRPQARWIPDSLSKECDENGWGAYNVEEVLLHELGHTLGLKQKTGFAEWRLMHKDPKHCFPRNKDYIGKSAWAELNLLYGKPNTQPVSITSPSFGQDLYAGQSHGFSASIPSTRRSTKHETIQEDNSIKATSNDINWVSDIDGLLGSGGSISVTNLSPGVHFVTAKVGEPGDAVYGSDVVAVNVVQQYYTDDADYFHPLPCVKLAGGSTDKCLMKYTNKVEYTACLSSSYYATLKLTDLDKNKSINPIFANRALDRCQDYQTDVFSWYFWLDASTENSKVKATFDFYNQGQCTYLSHWCFTTFATALVHVVEPTITLDPIDTQCRLATGESLCSVHLKWSNHFWSHDSAVFYRPLGTQDWIHLQDLGVSAGELDLPPFADENGSDIAVFQYKDDISTLIDGPSGMMTDPITVYGEREVKPLFMGESVLRLSAGQDEDPDSWNVLENGAVLNLTGNTWKAINYNYTITADTWLEFDYKSDGEDEPEIGGVMLVASQYNWEESLFQIHGTQPYGNQWFHRYFSNGWKTYRINIGRVVKGFRSSNRNLTQLGFIGDIDTPNKQIDISFRNPRLYESPTTHLPEWGHSGFWYEPDTNGQGFALEVNPINGVIAAEWFTYTEDGQGNGATDNRWYLQTGTYNPSNNYGETVSLDILRVTGGRFNNPNYTVTENVVGTAKIRFFDCSKAHVEYDFYTGINSGRNGIIPLQRVTPNVDCSIDEYTGSNKSDFGYTGNWYNPPTSGQGFAFEMNPVAGVFAAAWFTYLPGGSSNLGNPDRQRWFTLVGPYTPGNPSSNALTIYQNTEGALDNPFQVLETAIGTASVVFSSCTTAEIFYDFDDGGEFGGLSGSIELDRLTANVSCE